MGRHVGEEVRAARQLLDRRGEAEVGRVLVHARAQLRPERLDREVDLRARAPPRAAARGERDEVGEAAAARRVERRAAAEDEADRGERDAGPLRDHDGQPVRQDLAVDGRQGDGRAHRFTSGSSATTQRLAGSRYSAATRRTSRGPTEA